MTKFGKRVVLILFILAIIIISFIFYSIATMKPKFDFVLTDNGEAKKIAYMLYQKKKPAGNYYLECSSGYGVVHIDDKTYNLRNDKIKITYSMRFLNQYYPNGKISIPREDCIISITSQSKEEFIVKFKYIGDN